MKDEININLLLDRLYTTGKIDKRYMWALKDYITNLQETKDNMEHELQELYLIKDNLQNENERLKNEIQEKYIEWRVFDDVIGEISEILITKNVNFTKLELLKRRLLDKFYRY